MTKLMQISVRVPREARPIGEIPISAAFDMGLRAVLADAAISERARIRRLRSPSKSTSIRMTASQYYYMRSLGLNASTIIKIGYEQAESFRSGPARCSQTSH